MLGKKLLNLKSSKLGQILCADKTGFRRLGHILPSFIELDGFYQQRCLFVTYQIHKCVLKLAPAYLFSIFFSNSTFGYGCT